MTAKEPMRQQSQLNTFKIMGLIQVSR